MACKQALDDACVTTGDSAQQIIDANLSDYVLTDETFTFEDALSNSIASGGTAAVLSDRVLACLESNTEIGLSAVVQGLTLLTKEDLFSFSNHASQGKVNDVLSIVSHLLGDNEPPIKTEMSQCSFMKRCLGAIVEYCYVPKPSSSTVLQEGFRGVAALEYLVDSLGREDAVNLTQVKDLVLYAHWLPANLRVEAATLCKSASSTAGSSVAAVLSKKAKTKLGATTSKKNAAKETGGDSAVKAAQALFA